MDSDHLRLLVQRIFHHPLGVVQLFRAWKIQRYQKNIHSIPRKGTTKSIPTDH